jgi:translation initiation factor 2B subunit (eIF-2B alpha/beta/delta family)
MLSNAYACVAVLRHGDVQVVVAEGAPKFDGHQMARKLSDAGIQSTLITDSAVYAMMARVNKVGDALHAAPPWAMHGPWARLA